VLRTSAAAIVVTAEQAALPRVVSQEALYRANAIMSMTWSVMFAAGMALGGVLAMLGPLVALLVDAATFLVAAVLIRRLPPIRAAGAARAAARFRTIRGSFATVGRDLRESVGITWRSGPLLAAVLAKTPVALAGGSAWVLLNLVAGDPSLPGAGGVALGLLHAVRGTGTGVGPWWAARRIERGAFTDRQGRDVASWLAVAAMGVFAWVALEASHLWPAILGAVFFWGCGTGINWVLSTAAIQRDADDDVLGRVSSLDQLLATAGLGLGALVGALAVDVTAQPMAAGVVTILSGTVALLLVRSLTTPRLRGLAAR
jgi:predicted MFS family arabinose efflux permease